MRLKRILTYNLAFWLFAFLATATLHEMLPDWSEWLISPETPAEAQQAQSEPLGPAPPIGPPETPSESGGVPMNPTELAGHTGSDAVAATSWFSDGTARAVIFTIIIMFLAILLIGGALITVNLAMLSRRAEDHVGKRSPSDLGFLKNQVWPKVAYEKAEFPPVEDETYRQERTRIRNDEIPEQYIYVGSNEEQSVNSQGVPLREIRRKRQGENFLERDYLQRRKRLSSRRRRDAS